MSEERERRKSGWGEKVKCRVKPCSEKQKAKHEKTTRAHARTDTNEEEIND